MAYSEFSNPSRIGMTEKESLRKWLKNGLKECSGFLKACLIETEEEPMMAPWALIEIVDAYDGIEAFSIRTGISQQTLNELLVEKNNHNLDDYKSIIAALEKHVPKRAKKQTISTEQSKSVFEKTRKHLPIVPAENKLTHKLIEKRALKR